METENQLIRAIKRNKNLKELGYPLKKRITRLYLDYQMRRLK